MKKNKEKEELSKILYKIFQYYKKYVISILLLVLLSFGLNLVSPKIESKIIDFGILEGKFNGLVILVIALIFIKTLYNSSIFAQNIIKIILSIKINEEMSIKGFNHILRLKIKHIKKYGVYKILKDLEYDLTMITQIFSDQLVECIFELVQIIGYFVGLLIINWKMTLFISIIIPLKYLETSIVNGIREKKFEDLLKIQKQISEWQSNIFDGIYEIKLWNLYKKQEETYSDLLKKSNSIVKRINFLDGIDSFVNSVVENIIFNLLYVICGIYIWKNNMTLGEMVAFITFSHYLIQPVSILLRIKATYAEILPAFRSYLSFLKMEEENTFGDEKIQEINSIEFRNVFFSYEKENILNGISFIINKGEKVIIAGKNGAGKSSILSLLLRYYEPDAGQILINNIDITRIPIDEYRNLFSCVSQDVFLFNDTIENNICMGDENVGKIFNQNNLLGFLDKFEEKEKKIVGKNGIYLSGGEKQRIAFARCINKNAEILLADEVTANCDIVSKNVIKNILDTSKFKIVILVTHDNNMYDRFPRVIMIENGSIASNGTYEKENDLLKLEEQI